MLRYFVHKKLTIVLDKTVANYTKIVYNISDNKIIEKFR